MQNPGQNGDVFVPVKIPARSGNSGRNAPVPYRAFRSGFKIKKKEKKKKNSTHKLYISKNKKIQIIKVNISCTLALFIETSRAGTSSSMKNSTRDRKFRHEGIVSSSTDMFSFGVILLAAAREEEGMGRVLFIQMKGTNGWGSFYSNY